MLRLSCAKQLKEICRKRGLGESCKEKAEMLLEQAKRLKAQEDTSQNIFNFNQFYKTLRINFSDIGGSQWLGPMRKKYFETKASRMVKIPD